jgi:hypothetical protein
MDDVVYLKNGSEVRGRILQVYPDSVVQIMQAGGSIWNFPMQDIQMIAKEQKLRQKAAVTDLKGYQFGAGLGFLVRSGSNSTSFKAPLTVHVLNTYGITPAISAGAGVGLEFFQVTQLPVYLDLRYYYNRRSYASFVFMQGGAMVPLGHKQRDLDGSNYKGKTGYLLNPGIGFLLPLNEKTAFSISFSYRYHELRSVRETPLTDYQRTEKMNRFNIQLGFLFR